MNELPKFQDAWEVQPIPVAKRSENDFLYATHISDRWPRFKIHRTIGHAHAALAYRYHPRTGAKADMVFYRKAGDEWVPIQAWRVGEQARPEWWSSEPDPKEVEKRKRQTRFLDAYAVMAGCFQDPNITLEELQSLERELIRLKKELVPVIKRLSNDPIDHRNEK